MPINWKYKTLWLRAGAALVDFLVVLPAIVIQIVIIRAQVSPWLTGIILVVGGVVIHAYTVVMHWRFGATLGKMALGVKVVSLSEVPLTLRQALLREAVNIACSCYQGVREVSGLLAFTTVVEPEFWDGTMATLLVGLEFATALTNAKRRSIHDFIAGSVVIRVGVPAAQASQG